MIMANPVIPGHTNFSAMANFSRKSKKLIDAYVTTCELVDKRSKTPERTGAPPVGRLGLSVKGTGTW